MTSGGITARSYRQSVRRHAGPLVALIAALLCLPFTNAVWWLADEGIWLHAAQRLLRGDILYRDIFEFYPPLGFLIVTGWTATFGAPLFAARSLVILVVALSAWCVFACCRIVSGRTRLSAVLALSWVIGSQGIWTQVSHQWLSGLFSLVTLWAILSSTGASRRLALAGVTASAATLVTTHRGALVAIAGLATVLPRRSGKALAIYVASGLVPLAAILAWLGWQGTLGMAFAQVILFPLQQNARVMAVSFGAFTERQAILIVATFPLIAILIVAALWRNGIAIFRRPHIATAGGFALVALIGCFPRPDAGHIAFSVILALPLLAGLIDAVWPARVPTLFRAALTVLLLVLSGMPLLTTAIKSARAPRMTTSAGVIGIVPKNGTTALIDRLDTIPAGQKIFFYPYDPMLPFLTGKHHPARIDVFVPQYSTATQFRDTCHQVMRNADWVVVDLAIGRPAFYRAVFPAMTDPAPPEKRAFEAALLDGFTPETRLGDFLLLRRGKAATGPCGLPDTVAR